MAARLARSQEVRPTMTGPWEAEMARPAKRSASFPLSLRPVQSPRIPANTASLAYSDWGVKSDESKTGKIAHNWKSLAVWQARASPAEDAARAGQTRSRSAWRSPVRRRPLQRQYLLMPFFLVLGVPLTASCQEAPAPAVQSAAAYEATCRSFPACCRDHVYIFLVNGLDPINFGRLLGLRDYVRKLGFRQTYYGQMFHAAYFKKEIRRIHQEDPEAHFVFIGFSAGMNVAHFMAAP